MARLLASAREIRVFRVTVDPTGFHMRLEGRFVGQFAEEVKQLIVLHTAEVVVDLSDVTLADAAGEEALRCLRSLGAKFMAESSYALHLCERLQLPLLSAAVRRRGNQLAD